MKLRELVNQLPKQTGDPNKDIAALLAALNRIFRNADTTDPLVSAGGNVLVGNRALSLDATSGFLYVPTIDDSGPPTGRPANQGAGDPLVRTRDDNKLWFYSFERDQWEEFPENDDDNEILELLLLILRELQLQNDNQLVR